MAWTRVDTGEGHEKSNSGILKIELTYVDELSVRYKKKRKGVKDNQYLWPMKLSCTCHI